MGNSPLVRASRRPPEPEVNIVLVGEKGVGKTSLMWRMARGELWTNLPVPDSLHEMERRHIVNGKWIRARFLDTPGHDSPENMPPNIFRNADAVLILFDTTNQNIFDEFIRWFNVITDNADKAVKLFLVGTKSDLKPRAVNMEDVQQLGKTYGVLVLETSAKTYFGVSDSFISILHSLQHVVAREPVIESSIRLNEQPTSSNRAVFSCWSCVTFSRRSLIEPINRSSDDTYSTASDATYDVRKHVSSVTTPEEAVSLSNVGETPTTLETEASVIVTTGETLSASETESSVVVTTEETLTASARDATVVVSAGETALETEASVRVAEGEPQTALETLAS